MTFTDAQEMARPAFAQTRTPGLDAVAHVLQRAVTNEQNRLAAEIAKAEARCLDAENKAAALERDLAAAREREAKLREALFQIANGSACGAGTCMNCDTINQIANTTLDFEPARAAALDEA